MTTQSELQEIIANGENSGTEFKRDSVRPHELAKELVALSNLNGGRVLLGVDDNGTILGLTRERIEEWVMTVCRDKMRPGVIPFFEVVHGLSSGKDVAVVSLPQGIDVQSLWYNNRHTYYVRVGSLSREPTPQELSRLFQQRGMLRTDIRPVSGATFRDLDLRRLKDYFAQVRQQPIPEDEDEDAWQQLLMNTEIMVEGSITLSGVLLFAELPNRFLPQAGIEAAAFPGKEKEYAARERTSLRGPMVRLADTKGGILETGIVERSLEFVRRNTPVTAVLEDGARRVEKLTYPPEVIREAVVNALIHRDYLLSHTDIELSVYEDRLEIISPGRLPNGITPERMRAGVRAARNPLLKDVMRDYGYLEHMGMGVPRRIVRGMREHNQTEPDLIDESERFTLRLYARHPESAHP